MGCLRWNGRGKTLVEEEKHQANIGDEASRRSADDQPAITGEQALPAREPPDLERLQQALAELNRTKSLLQNEAAAREQAERELRKAKDITEATIRAREEFLATMSHELRTPLSVVLGYTDLLEGGEFGGMTEQQVDVLKRVKRNAGELLGLIDALLDASQLQVGRASLSVTEVRLGQLLEDVWTETKDLREGSTIEFRYDVQDPETVLRTDIEKIKIVVRNLLNNARKFTDHGQVMLRGGRKNDGVEICVSDTGIGIEKEEIPFIFQPFRKVGTALTRSKGGAGLGLYVVKNFLDLLRGTISVESEVGRGSTFRIWLPTTPTIEPSG
jgi:signal transduction histidine kinase